MLVYYLLYCTSVSATKVLTYYLAIRYSEPEINAIILISDLILFSKTRNYVSSPFFSETTWCFIIQVMERRTIIVGRREGNFCTRKRKGEKVHHPPFLPTFKKGKTLYCCTQQSWKERRPTPSWQKSARIDLVDAENDPFSSSLCKVPSPRPD